MMETLLPIQANTLQQKPMKYIKKESFSATECANCGTTTTPLWRRGPSGKTICNACGLYLKARNTLRPPTLKRTVHNKKPQPSTPLNKNKNDCGGGTCPGGGQCNGTGGSSSCAGCPAFNQHQVNRQTLICANCRTTTTPLWRRDEQGNTICNACGLYYKLHNVHRPVSMKRSVIKRRKRIIVAQGSEEEEDDDDTQSQVSSNPSFIPEIEDYVVTKKKKLNHGLPIEFLPPISLERQSHCLDSIFNRIDSIPLLPPLSLPPLTPPSPIQSPPRYELSQFDEALDKLKHLRRRVRPEQAFALSQITRSLSELASKAEAILSFDGRV